MDVLPGMMGPVPMPDKYIAEMVMDRIAACKVYMGKSYTNASSLEYYYKGTDRAPLHEYTRKRLVEILTMLAEEGEDKTFSYIKKELLRKK